MRVAGCCDLSVARCGPGGVCVPVCGTRRCALTTVFSESYQLFCNYRFYAQLMPYPRARRPRPGPDRRDVFCAAHRADALWRRSWPCSWHRCDVGVRETRDQTNFSIAAMWASLIVRIDFVRARRV